MISNVLEGFDGVDKLKAMSKQVEYLILFDAFKLLSPIQLSHQYGLSFNCFTNTPNANMADLSVGPGLVARKRG